VRRASYREAIAWIADNDEAGDDDATVVDVVRGYTTVVLVADVFDVDADKVAADVVKARKKRP